MWIQNLPNSGGLKLDVFYGNTYVAATNWQIWEKPFGCKFVYIFVQGAGGGGARPQTGSTTLGAGGGSAGCSARIITPAHFLPNQLYLSIAKGGLGATTANSAGSAAVSSYISAANNASSGLVTLGAFNGGNGGAIFSGGSAASNPTLTYNISLLGIFSTNAGQAGSAGGNIGGASGSNLSALTTSIISTGGTGGGNSTGNGGNLTGSGYIPSLAGGLGTNGGAGLDGIGYNEPINPSAIMNLNGELPYYFTGGTGGGGHTTGVAGKGGNGGYGSGGGGGGSCNNAAGTSGNGGNGGDGFVIIASY